MIQKKNSQLIYALKLIIPLIIIFGLFIGGVSTGIITFEKPKKITGEVTVSILIDFGDGEEYSNILTIENSTVFNLLLEIQKIGDIIVKTNEEGGSYEIDTITYKGKKYEHGNNGNWWLFYVNSDFAQASADKTYVNDNDIIEWKYESF
jgi:hypothetical protein